MYSWSCYFRLLAQCFAFLKGHKTSTLILQCLKFREFPCLCLPPPSHIPPTGEARASGSGRGLSPQPRKRVRALLPAQLASRGGEGRQGSAASSLGWYFLHNLFVQFIGGKSCFERVEKARIRVCVLSSDNWR